MSFGRLSWVVTHKEMVDGIRDRRALMSALTFPLLGPIMIAVMLSVISSEEEIEGPLEVPVIGVEHAPNLVRFLTEQGVTGVKNMPVSSAIKKGDSEWILTMEQEERWKEICKFVEEHNMGKLNRKKKRFLLECSREQVDTFKLGIIIAESCKQMDLRGAFQSYREYKAMGVFPSFDDACNLLSLVAGFLFITTAILIIWQRAYLVRKLLAKP